MEQLANKEIVFVYKATSGAFHALLDYAHKLFSPQTYPCSLCGMTYGHLGMKRLWAKYLKSLPYPYRFLYQDQLKDLPEEISGVELPVIFLLQGGDCILLLGAEELAELNTLEQLIDRLDQSLTQSGAR